MLVRKSSGAGGAAGAFEFTISTTQVDANLRTLAIAAGWDQSSEVIATIASGVWVNGSVAGNSTPALTIDGSWPGGVTLVNNGYIVGRGGNGYNGNPSAYTTTQAGGRALSVTTPVTIDNLGTIAGGGGGGHGSSNASYCRDCEMGESSGCAQVGGSGGGGGRSNTSYNSSGGTPATDGGVTGNAGAAGTSSAFGNGGAGVSTSSCGSCTCSVSSYAGGNGGDWGASGTLPINLSGAYYYLGAGGEAVNGNANVTWATVGTRLGTIV